MTGPQGEQGPEGKQGPQGERGVQGEQGLKGERGPQGEQGLKGQRGPQGEQGLKGERGPQGEQGLKGQRGPQGEQGLKGERGPQGEQGPEGKQGPRGEQGPEGKQGPKGDQGLKGDRGPEGRQGLKGERGPQGQSGGLGLSEKKKLWLGDFLAGQAGKAPIKHGHHAESQNKASISQLIHNGAEYLKDKIHSSKGRSDFDYSDKDVDDVEQQVTSLLVGEDCAREPTTPSSQENEMRIGQDGTKKQGTVFPASDSAAGGSQPSSHSVGGWSNKTQSKTIVFNNYFRR
ncbi:hypothetical protein ACFFJT_05315 [Dyella flava]|nr:hypothetical protein [Dyella flava]